MCQKMPSLWKVERLLVAIDDPDTIRDKAKTQTKTLMIRTGTFPGYGSPPQTYKIVDGAGACGTTS